MREDPSKVVHLKAARCLMHSPPLSFLQHLRHRGKHTGAQV